MKLPNFEYLAPSTVSEIVKLLASHPGEAKLLAGGQSLLPTMAYRLAQPALLIDLKNVKNLNRITVDNDSVCLGARVRWRDIEDSRKLATDHPLLKEAINHVAHYQIRNRGTVGGSLAHADPASELPCIAVTCEAVIHVVGSHGERTIKAEDFFLGPLTTALADDEIIVKIELPSWLPERRWSFKEFSRRAGDFALAGVAVFYDLDSQQRICNAHIGVVGACSIPHRLSNAERTLNGNVVSKDIIIEAGQAAAQEVKPTGDMHASVSYRRALVGTLLQKALHEAAVRE